MTNETTINDRLAYLIETCDGGPTFKRELQELADDASDELRARLSNLAARGSAVRLTSIGDNKAAVIQVVRDHLSDHYEVDGKIGADEAKELVENAPCLIEVFDKESDALALAGALKAAGADAEALPPGSAARSHADQINDRFMRVACNAEALAYIVRMAGNTVSGKGDCAGMESILSAVEKGLFGIQDDINEVAADI